MNFDKYKLNFPVHQAQDIRVEGKRSTWLSWDLNLAAGTPIALIPRAWQADCNSCTVKLSTPSLLIN